MKHKFIVERTDGTTDRIEADFFHCSEGVINFFTIISSYEQTKEEKDACYASNIVRTYPYQGVVCVMPYEEGEESSNEEPERQENTNDDLISRGELLNYISTHWTEDIKSVIKDFPKARFVN